MSYRFEGQTIDDSELKQFVADYLSEHYSFARYREEMRDNAPDAPVTEQGYEEELADRIDMTVNDPANGFIIGLTED